MSTRLLQRERLLRRLLLRVRPAPVAAFLKRVFRVRRVMVDTPVGSFWVDPVSELGDSLLRHGVYEPFMMQTLERFLFPSAVFVDVGANEGFFSVVGGLLTGPTGRVLAIEPQRRLRDVLERNIELNSLRNVTLSDVAVSDTEGVAELHLSPDTNSGATGLTRAGRWASATEIVRTARLERVLDEARVGSVDLMKMDIEGFEYEAVLGSPGLFRSHRVRVLALELHPRVLRARGRDPAEVVRFLRRCGYREDCVQRNTVFVSPRVG